MKQLKIESLELLQFQKFDYKKISFGDITDVSGDNGTGKTTIYSALTWLLFGKDSLGREKFDVKRIVDGVKQDKVDVEVIGKFIYNNEGTTETIELRRVLSEKWDEKNDVYKGDETKCYINGVPKLVGEYNSFVYSIISEDNFRILTSVTYFLGLKQDEQREYLCKMAGVRNINEIVKGVDEWEKVVVSIPQNISIDDYTKTIKDALKGYKDEKKGIQPAINALVQSMPQEENWNELESLEESISQQIKNIDKMLMDSDSASALIEQKNDNIRKEIDELTTSKYNAIDKLNKIEFDAKQKEVERVRLANKEYDDTEARIRDLSLRSNRLSAQVANERIIINSLDNEVTEFYNQYMTENAKAFVKSSCLKCPLSSEMECKTTEVLAKYKQDEQSMMEEFNNKKVFRLKEIIEKGKAKKTELNAAKESLRQHEMEYESLCIKIETEKRNLSGMKHETASANITKSTEMIALEAEIDKIENSIKSLRNHIVVRTKSEETDGLKTKKADLMVEWKNIIRRIESRSQIERTRTQIDSLTEKGKTISRKITECENLIDTLAEIKRAVVEDAATRINAMFQVTHWVTAVQQKNGDWKDCCIPTINGVSASLNSASRINVGLDICHVIGKYLGISVPCFIDNRESVNEIINLEDTQVINLRVAPKGTPLTINYDPF